MQLNANDIHIWTQNIHELTSQVFIELENYLSSSEKTRASRFLHEADRKRFAIAYGMLRKILGDHFQIDPKSFTFQTTEHEKPYLESHQIEFNLSHSGDFVVWAFSLHPVGIDVEYMNRKVEILDLAKRFFAQEEYEVIQKLPKLEQQGAFYRCWTRKEAFIKASGEGLSYPLSEFVVELAANLRSNCLKSIHGCESLASDWFLTAFDLPDDYEGAVAIKNPTVQLHILSL